MKKTISIILAMAALLAALTACGESSDLHIISERQRLLNMASSESGVRYRDMQIPVHITAEAIPDFVGMELAVDADIVLPKAEAIPIAKATKRSFTQEEADRLLSVWCKDETLVDSETGEPANQILSEGSIEGEIHPGYRQYDIKNKHVRICDDSAVCYLNPCSDYRAFDSYDDPNLEEIAASDFSQLHASTTAENFSEEVGMLNDMAREEHTVLLMTKYNAEKKTTSWIPGVLYEYYPLVSGVPVVEDADLEYTGMRKDSVYESRNTIVVGKNQIRFAHLAAPFSKMEILENDCAMMPFDDIMTIFNGAVSSVGEKWAEAYSDIVLQSAVLSKVTLCEMFVQDESGSDSGMLIPVWDFQVTFSAPLPLPWHRTVMTINAIDGSIIERYNLQ